LSTRAGDKGAGGAYPEVGSAGDDVFDSVDIGAALANLDFKTGVTVKALLKGGIITGELKLVKPFELEGYDVDCLCG
jgi:hypothetical protein